jgi:signal transduction histidine kinase
VIQGFIEMVQEGTAGPTTPQQQQIFHRVRRAATGMLSLIDTFLDVTAIEAGRLELVPREVDLDSFLGEVHLENRLLAEAKSIDLRLDLCPSLPRIVVDPNRMSQVVNNLIGNAIKFSFPGTTVTLRSRLAGDQVEISVTDQGQGIPTDELPRLLDGYGRGSVRPTAGERSTGLGLAIVRRMVEAHRGSLRVESTVGAGSTFTVSLPLRATTPSARADLSSVGTLSAPATESPSASAAAPAPPQLDARRSE